MRPFNVFVAGFCAMGALVAFVKGYVTWGLVETLFVALNVAFGVNRAR